MVAHRTCVVATAEERPLLPEPSCRHPVGPCRKHMAAWHCLSLMDIWGETQDTGEGGCLDVAPALYPHLDLLLCCSHLPTVLSRHTQEGAHRNCMWRHFCFLEIEPLAHTIICEVAFAVSLKYLSSKE